MANNGTLNKADAAKLPAVPGTPVFLNGAQNTSAANYLAANWTKAVS
jgi:hypothetical protein